MGRGSISGDTPGILPRPSPALRAPCPRRERGFGHAARPLGPGPSPALRAPSSGGRGGRAIRTEPVYASRATFRHASAGAIPLLRQGLDLGVSGSISSTGWPSASEAALAFTTASLPSRPETTSVARAVAEAERDRAARGLAVCDDDAEVLLLLGDDGRRRARSARRGAPRR